MGETLVRGHVLLAAPRGFCAGVERAVNAVEQALNTYGAPVYVRRQIVHNAHVVARLEQRGAIFVREADEVPEGAVLLLSAHGVAPEVRVQASARSLHTIDATCPLVTKIHREARRFARDGYTVILIGEPGHDEVIGTRGEAPEQVIVVTEPGDIDRIEVRDPERVAWISQSTLVVEFVADMVSRLRERFPALADPPREDICYAVSNRQAALRAIASRCDLMLVVGSANSHNAGRLVPAALAAGARAARRVDCAAELRPDWLDGVRTIGVTSGASTPDSLVQGVLAWLAEHGYPVGEEVVSKVETQVFAPPRTLVSVRQPAALSHPRRTRGHLSDPRSRAEGQRDASIRDGGQRRDRPPSGSAADRRRACGDRRPPLGRSRRTAGRAGRRAGAP
jgi:4-hydroxy-3-methylbut-2-en-1-yl diphosphate reductase